MQEQILPVPFHGDTLVMVDHNNQPFVAMRSVVENMGLDWGGQYVKLKEKFSSVVEIISTTAGDGKKYDMTCLPLRKLAAWLYSINPNKVAEHLRDKVRQYQDECDDALWDYWTKGSAVRGGEGANTGQQLSAINTHLKLLDRLEIERHPEKRAVIYQQLEYVSRMLGLQTPDIDKLGYAHVEPDVDPLVGEFWDAVEYIGLDKLDHSKDEGFIALNLPHLAKVAAKAKVPMPSLSACRRVLAGSKEPKFVVSNQVVRSKLEDRTMRCWVFRVLVTH